MTTYIALYRGINVGGSHRLPMKELQRLLERNGCAGVRTYIQSGNAVFRSAASDPQRLAADLGAAVRRTRGFEPRVLLLTATALERAVARNPFPEADADPARVHLFFLFERPKTTDLTPLDAVKGRERFALNGLVFYLHTPDGLGTSKVPVHAGRLLGVETTARNWRTVTKLLDMAREAG